MCLRLAVGTGEDKRALAVFFSSTQSSREEKGLVQDEILMPHAKLGFVPPSNTPSPTIHGNLVCSQVDRLSAFFLGVSRLIEPTSP